MSNNEIKLKCPLYRSVSVTEKIIQNGFIESLQEQDYEFRLESNLFFISNQ